MTLMYSRTGDTSHQIIDGQRLYRRLTACYEKIDSTSYVKTQFSPKYNIDLFFLENTLHN